MINKSILFLVNKSKDEDLRFSKEVISFLKNNGCIVFIEKEICDCIDEKVFDSKDKVDIALVLGGDGTLLNKLHEYVNYDFIYYGINLGRVGCLMEAQTNNYQEMLLNVLSGNYLVEERNTLEYVVTTKDQEIQKGYSFNEVSVERGSLYKMMLINMYINKKNKTSFYADGVIVATSTGSSGYNLSSGGPLLLPTAHNYVITPLCPQLRTITSLVVNDSDEVEIDISDPIRVKKYDKEKPVVFIDGKIMIEIDETTKIALRKGEKILKMAKVNNEKSLFEPIFKVTLSSQNLFNK